MPVLPVRVPGTPSEYVPSTGFHHDGPTSSANGFTDPLDDILPADNEDVNMEPHLTSQRTTQHFLPGTLTYERQPNTLERLDSDPYAQQRQENMFFPFASKDEWDLARFLSETLNQTETERFLKLNFVRLSCYLDNAVV